MQEVDQPSVLFNGKRDLEKGCEFNRPKIRPKTQNG